MSKKAIIVGYAGQDGTILLNSLKSDGYEIIGIGKKDTFCHAVPQISNINISDYEQVSQLIKIFLPDEVYYLASYHHSSEDHTPNEYNNFLNSINTNTIYLFNFLEALRNYQPNSKLFYAASSHIFGNPKIEIQNENTPISPICFYGISKASGLFLCKYYRNEHKMFACVGILYNHESKYRKANFLSKKIVNAAIEIAQKKKKHITLGDLDSVVDWGYAPDYVQAMRKIMNTDQADDYIIASGNKHSVKDFVERAFQHFGLDWKEHIRLNPDIIQKSKRFLIGDITKISKQAGWKPSLSFDMLVDQLIKDERNNL